MADRFFPNEMPEFVAEAGEDEAASGRAKDSLTKLLHLPYKSLAERLQKSALDLKEAVVRETWGLSAKRRFWACDIYMWKGWRLCSWGCHSKHSGDEKLLERYLTQFKEISLPSDLPNELFNGRAGFLWACLFLNKHIGKDTISATRTRPVVDDIIKAGRRLSSKGKCPLMYEWHGKKYWGAAHGLAGILHVLMDMELKPDEVEDVKGTLCYMIKNRYPSGNYPSSEGSESDRLVHWCHGAPGIALTLVKAAEVYGGKEFLQAAVDAGDVVWNRGLLKRVGICHGISGNTYVFLCLYRLTGKVEYLYRAKAFACFLLDRAQKLISEGKMHGGDRPHSLFEGIGGMAYLFLDMTEPSDARFPAYEL
ncbi:hypothetical protein SLA2020_389060 [Shorea laevis]